MGQVASSGLHIMKGARIDPQVIAGVKYLTCGHCSEIAQPSHAAPVKAPSVHVHL